MYLTRFRINPQRRGAKKLLASPQAMHAAVLAGYPDPPKAEGGPRILWRVDSHAPRAVLYISGPSEPDLTHLVEQAGWPSLPNPWETKPYKPFLDGLSVGQEWIFRLTANPVRHGRAPNRDDTIPMGQVTVDSQEEWLTKRSSKNGFEIAAESLAVQASQLRQFDRQRKTVTLQVVTYDGVLTVTDPESFRERLASGFGRARAYGCGLMTLSKP